MNIAQLSGSFKCAVKVLCAKTLHFPACPAFGDRAKDRFSVLPSQMKTDSSCSVCLAFVYAGSTKVVAHVKDPMSTFSMIFSMKIMKIS